MGDDKSSGHPDDQVQRRADFEIIQAFIIAGTSTTLLVG
jgi:hypothetical protein